MAWPLELKVTVACIATGGMPFSACAPGAGLIVADTGLPGRKVAPPVPMMMLPLKFTVWPNVTEKSWTPMRMSLKVTMPPSEMAGEPFVVLRLLLCPLTP